MAESKLYPNGFSNTALVNPPVSRSLCDFNCLEIKGKSLGDVASKRFPNTIYEVVHQKLGGRAQFSPIDDGRYYSVPITGTTEQAVTQALEGVNYSEGALFFVAKSLASDSAGSWFDNNLNFIMTYGVHSFYKY